MENEIKHQLHVVSTVEDLVPVTSDPIFYE